MSYQIVDILMFEVIILVKYLSVVLMDMFDLNG